MTESGASPAAATASAADDSLQFERLLAHVAASFIEPPIDCIDEVIDDGLSGSSPRSASTCTPSTVDRPRSFMRSIAGAL
jgi:hypothetical protein